MGMGCLRGAGGSRLRHRHLDGHAVGGRTVPAGTVVSHDEIRVAKAAKDIAVEEAGALHGFDHAGVAAVLGAMDVVTGDARSGRALPGEPNLSRLDRDGERLCRLPLRTGPAAILLG